MSPVMEIERVVRIAVLCDLRIIAAFETTISS